MNLSNLVKTSYSKDDVTILLQDVKGRVPVLDTAERERLNQSGVHYSEMLPLEYKPTETYMKIYEDTLNNLSYLTASAVELLADKLMKKFGDEPITLVSLARAGTPVGILLKRYLYLKYNKDCKHYSISIIRGKGIDVAAMKYIVSKYPAKSIQFVDGWVGKGAIGRQLDEAVKDLLGQEPVLFEGLSSELAVLSDPACETELYGTRQDFLIPSACLNATVSGLVSRTVKLKTMTDDELHGAVYYGEYKDVDKSIHFIDEVCAYFKKELGNPFKPSKAEENPDFKGIDEVKKIAQDYKIKDVNKVKPGIGETTRVLLRRVPDRVLIRRGILEDESLKANFKHILQLCKEKDIPIEEYDLQKYNVCGLIKDLSASDL